MPKNLYSFGRKELRYSGARSAHRIPARFVQHGPWVEGHSVYGSPRIHDSRRRGNDMFMIDDLKTQEKKVTAKYANHAKKEADSGLRLRGSGLIRLCPVSSGSGHV